jgi:hypothetical protein
MAEQALFLPATFRPIFKPTQPHIQCLPGAIEYSFPLNLQESGKNTAFWGTHFPNAVFENLRVYPFILHALQFTYIGVNIHVLQIRLH